ncbi:MAG TPA: pitrilysin family protein [Vicinamibacteria bacterium]|nr:pitrilysin family protein [Vicinamibacteria bacterium]
MTRLAAFLALLAGPAALGVDRSKPPAAGPPRPLRLPSVQKLALSNGLPVLLAEAHEVPVVQVTLVLRAGATSDPRDRPGLAAFTADMLDEGAGGRDALSLADAVDFLGARLETGAEWDAAFASLRVPVARLEAALPLLADVALRPDFPPKELERLRKEALNDLLQARDEPARVGSWALALAVFGAQHRYGAPLGGDARSLAAITAGGLRQFHDRAYRPGNAALVIAGDVTSQALPLLEAAFGGWAEGGPQGAATLASPPQPKGRTLWLIDRPGSAQSVIRIGRVAPGQPAPDQHALEVANTLLGGSFTSRLNDNLREQHGYAYGARSLFDQRRAAGLFTAAADVQTQSTAEALAEFMKELRRIRMPAPPDEVERARSYLALSYAADFETTSDLAGKLAEQWLYALPDDFYAQFVPRALAVSPSDLQKAAAARIDPENLAIVIVGDRSRVETKLRALGLGPLRIMTVDDVMGKAPKAD